MRLRDYYRLLDLWTGHLRLIEEPTTVVGSIQVNNYVICKEALHGLHNIPTLKSSIAVLLEKQQWFMLETDKPLFVVKDYKQM